MSELPVACAERPVRAVALMRTVRRRRPEPGVGVGVPSVATARRACSCKSGSTPPFL